MPSGQPVWGTFPKKETRTNRGLLFEIGTQVWNENPRKTFHRWYFSPEVDPWQAVVAAG
jgi:hypothetical protein